MPAEVLNSWKEIAAYVGRGVRTVQRWELELNFPIHRTGKGRHHSAVAAVKSEIDLWFRTAHGVDSEGNHHHISYETKQRLASNAKLLQANASKLLTGCDVLKREIDRAILLGSALQISCDGGGTRSGKGPSAGVRQDLISSKKPVARARELVNTFGPPQDIWPSRKGRSRGGVSGSATTSARVL